MGFTTTFIVAGDKDWALENGREQVKLVCKTKRAQPRMEMEQNHTKSLKENKKNNTQKKETKNKKNQKNSNNSSRKATEFVEDISEDDFDDVVDMLSSHTTNTASKQHQYPLIPQSKSSGRIPERHVEALAQLLKDWRASVCDNFNVMPYHILPTSGIAAIATAVPVTSTELSAIEGVGRIRVKKYGDAIIEIVKSYLNKVKLRVYLYLQ
jgi:superfamily II DNA helicase RecQ